MAFFTIGFPKTIPNVPKRKNLNEIVFRVQ
jgi:hypothetical protein